MKEEMLAALASLGSPPKPGSTSITSDLSVDESLLLHGAGFEPADLVSAVSVQSIPYGSFMTSYGQAEPLEVTYASQAVTGAFRAGAARLRELCARSGGSGVVGVDVDVEIGVLSTRVAFTGTAIRPIGGASKTSPRPFVTDLSTKDFVLLMRSGWEPVDLATGASFVAAPYQRLRQSLAQTTQNIELPNLTQAFQDARELAMERMQHDALGASAQGIVDVTIIDGPLGHARHVFAFICYGTAVRLVAERHRLIAPDLVLPLDDHAGFEATSLR
ncbi:MAG: heavy metal-binding domain-containing protein [Acidimicrobiales bacterium]